MFERISGFFKRFTRRRSKQSGETTIMDGKEPGLDEFGLDEGFGEPVEMQESIDSVRTMPAASEPGTEEEGVFSGLEFETGDDAISTGASDFDERTISDEISGTEAALEEAEEGLPGEFAAEGEAPPFEEAVPEPEPVPPAKRIMTLAIVGVIGIILGAVIQLFLWPVVGKLVGLSGSDQPELNIQTQLSSAQQKNRNLTTEIGEFRKMGGPAEVKGLQQELIQLRDSQGPLEEFESEYNIVKQREAEYDELIARIGEIETNIADTRADISDVKIQIGEAQARVLQLARQTEEAYERFRLELTRADLSRRLLIELQMQDIEQFQIELSELQEQLAKLAPIISPMAPPESVPPSDVVGTDAVGS